MVPGEYGGGRTASEPKNEIFILVLYEEILSVMVLMEKQGTFSSDGEWFLFILPIFWISWIQLLV